MKIELKNIKHHKGMSEETNAFTATLYVDGKRIADASNRGHGEAVMLRPFEGCRDALDAAESYLASLPRVSFGNDLTIQPDLDYVLSRLVGTDLARREVHQRVKRTCGPKSTKTLIYRPDTNEVKSYGMEAGKRYKQNDKIDTGANIALQSNQSECPEAQCLNHLYNQDPDTAYRLFAKGLGLEDSYNWTISGNLAR